MMKNTPTPLRWIVLMVTFVVMCPVSVLQATNSPEQSGGRQAKGGTGGEGGGCKPESILGSECNDRGNSLPTMPDFYEEAGLNPFREQTQDHPVESIDPFSGQLSIIHTDLVVQGNGGLDLAIIRSYKNTQDAYTQLGQGFEKSNIGVGWQLHFGRILQNTATCPVQNSNVGDNAIFELPDQRNQFFAWDTTDSFYISRDRWRAECSMNGWTVRSPDGIKYTLDFSTQTGQRADLTWFVTRIEDLHGNWIDIDWRANSLNYPYIYDIDTSDGRHVSFSYNYSGDQKIRLSSFTFNNRTWSFQYSSISGATDEHWHLDRVTRPDGKKWEYDYFSGSANDGAYCLEEIVYPWGGQSNYTYDLERFDSSSTLDTTVVKSKSISGLRVSSATWTYTYDQNTSFDTTTVTFPNGLGKDVYKHFGIRSVSDGSVWKVGLLQNKQTYYGGLLIESIGLVWDSQVISNEPYSNLARGGTDTNVRAPILTDRNINRSGSTFSTDYTNHDAYGNPRSVLEQGNSGSRSITLKYFINTSNWIVQRLEDETFTNLSANNKVDRTFNSTGQLTRESRFGAESDFQYDSQGNLYRAWDPENNLVTFTNYYRGTPQAESHPEQISIARDVDNNGWVQWERNGRLHTTYFDYNSLGWIEQVRPPVGNYVNVSYSTAQRNLTRGGFSEQVIYDGFGRPYSHTAEGITTNIRYNALGHKTFQSYPNGGTTAGIDTTFDTLGRPVELVHGDGFDKDYSYQSGNRVRLVNERNKVTTFTYRSYGDPNEGYLTNIDGPGSNDVTIGRNVIGSMISATRGGTNRYYYYNSKQHIDQITHPEIGNVIYGRDSNGNMTSRRVGNATTYFTYDGLNRLTFINYPSQTPDVTLEYDKNSNLTDVMSSIANWEYQYNPNNVLQQETLQIDGKTFVLNWGLNTNDYISTVTYPSGRQISFNPDDLGRPRQATSSPMHFATNITWHPTGTPDTISLGSGKTIDYDLDIRRRVEDIEAGSSSNRVRLHFSFDGRSNVQSITDYTDNDFTINNITYDDVDRLKTASNALWGSASFDYDGKGNILSKTVAGNTQGYNYSSSTQRLTSMSKNGTSFMSFSYDTYGNVVEDSFGVYDYDDASNMRSTSIDGEDTFFDYDGYNKRVVKDTEDYLVYYFYARDGSLYGIYNDEGDLVEENVYVAGRLIANIKEVPAQVGNVSAPTSDIDGNYTVSWSPLPSSSIFTDYELFETATGSGEVRLYRGDATSRSLTGRGNGVYSYRVRACNAYVCGDSQFSDDVNVTLPPSTPVSISNPPTSNVPSIPVSWATVPETVTYYELQLAENPSFSGALSVYQGPLTSHTANVVDDGTFYFRVRACNTPLACSSWRVSPNSTVVILPVGPPGVVNNPQFSATGDYVVSWTDGPGVASYYELEEAQVLDFSDASQIFSGDALSYNVTGRGEGDYHYRVRACSSLGDCSSYTISMNATGVRLPPDMPPFLTAPDTDNDGSYEVSWLSPANPLTHYELQEADSSSFSNAVLIASPDCASQGGCNSHSISGQLDGTYYYRVRACNGPLPQSCSSFYERLAPTVVNLGVDLWAVTIRTGLPDGSDDITSRVENHSPANTAHNVTVQIRIHEAESNPGRGQNMRVVLPPECVWEEPPPHSGPGSLEQYLCTAGTISPNDERDFTFNTVDFGAYYDVRVSVVGDEFDPIPANNCATTASSIPNMDCVSPRSSEGR